LILNHMKILHFRFLVSYTSQGPSKRKVWPSLLISFSSYRNTINAHISSNHVRWSIYLDPIINIQKKSYAESD
jgi:hypothetical protein